MHVLDIGCGRGDVALMLADIVGEQGRVVGVDRDVQALATAKARARSLGLTNLAFAAKDLDALSLDIGSFDAVIGRRVLMYLPDPARAVATLAGLLRPGGLVVFQEHDATVGPRISGSLPLHEQVHDWIWKTVQGEGGDTRMGFHLHGVLLQAGLVVEQVRAEAVVLTPTAHYPIAAIVRAMLPRIMALNLAAEDEIDVETLDARLAQERRQAGATCVWDMAFGAWASKPL
jgi:SAM-dependent methyltransferase